jgi:hypothetical protein
MVYVCICRKIAHCNKYKHFDENWGKGKEKEKDRVRLEVSKYKQGVRGPWRPSISA